MCVCARYKTNTCIMMWFLKMKKLRPRETVTRPRLHSWYVRYRGRIGTQGSLTLEPLMLERWTDSLIHSTYSFIHSIFIHSCLLSARSSSWLEQDFSNTLDQRDR